MGSKYPNWGLQTGQRPPSLFQLCQDITDQCASEEKALNAWSSTSSPRRDDISASTILKTTKKERKGFEKSLLDFIIMF